MSQLNPDAGRVPLAPSLRDCTTARVALGRTGASQTTKDVLEFSLAHAEARDAVHASLSLPTLLDALKERALPAATVRSAARDRKEYLRRPDLGRRLSETSAAAVLELRQTSERPTLSIVVADGLSALAVDRNAVPLLDALLPLLADFELAPIVVAEQARVALGDEIGQALGANLTIVLVGERPGLSSPDSLGVYITWDPRVGRTDAERNCISNIRTEGLGFAEAARKIAFLCREARRLGLSGVAVKEESAVQRLEAGSLRG